MNIGEKIKRIRQHRRMTQKELGELVDLSANRIAQYEMGYRVPKKPLLNQIAEALRVSPLALSDGGNGPTNGLECVVNRTPTLPRRRASVFYLLIAFILSKNRFLNRNLNRN